jgi:acyl-coenzyme A synthetase/AMP-(fatty) acid ligase
MATAAVDTIVGDRGAADLGADDFLQSNASVSPGAVNREPGERTEWVLLTSGTTGVPKLVRHTLATLAGAMLGGGALGHGAVWSTFYDMRRYGGLQIFLRAMLGGGSMVLSSTLEPVGAFLARAGTRGVTHISGTPSHWRRALMSAAIDRIAPRYVRLSGEIADQAILDHLRAAFPVADIAHAFASTEAGVAFDVGDGRAGFPAAYLGRRGAVEMRVCDGSLRIRSGRNSLGYLGDGVPQPFDDESYVDTGDIVELREGRYHFVGRQGGVINIGGQKVHPEEIEAVINRHPEVQMSRVMARKNPITGAIVVADVVVTAETAALDAVKGQILAACRGTLARYKVPATIRFVPAIEVAASGKLARANA